MLVLASSSPRRRELLRNAAIRFVVHPADVPETMLPGEDPTDFAVRLACEKAHTVWQRMRDEEHDCPVFVLGADTIVVVNGEVLGKPSDAADAARMLRLLSARTHEVTTAVCLVGPNPQGNSETFQDARAATTRVTFEPLTEEDIRDYVAHGEPMDKAGAYAIQGIASRWISKLEGDYFNVVGLPVPLVYRMLREHNAI